LIDRFRACTLSNEEVLNGGGHGCHTDRPSIAEAPIEFIAVTGPNRDLLRNERVYAAVPYGDMMLTGCFGLLDAARKAGIIGE